MQAFVPAEAKAKRTRILELVAEQLGVSPEELGENPQLVNDLGADSLDTVELIMELEEEFG